MGGPAVRRTQPDEETLGPGAAGPCPRASACRLRSQIAWVGILVTFTRVTLGKYLLFFMLRFPHLENGDANSMYLTEAEGGEDGTGTERLGQPLKRRALLCCSHHPS